MTDHESEDKMTKPEVSSQLTLTYPPLGNQPITLSRGQAKALYEALGMALGIHSRESELKLLERLWRERKQETPRPPRVPLPSVPLPSRPVWPVPPPITCEDQSPRS